MTTPDALAALQRETGRAFVEISAPPGGQVSHATHGKTWLDRAS